MIKSFKLFENPDSIEFNNKNIPFTYASEGTICFSYYEGELYAEENYTHDELYKLKYGVYPGEENHFGRGEYSGRIYEGEKIITFWHFPENKEKMKEIINDLEEETKMKIWDNYYFVEVPQIDKNKINPKYWSNIENDIEFIALEEYKGVEVEYNFGRDIPHLMDWEEKQKLKRPENFGSRADKRPLKWKQALLKSENKLNESPDHLIFDGVKIDYKNGYVFGFYDSEFLFKEGKTHFWFNDEKGRRPTRDGMDYPGRFWKLKTGNYISFWEYPEPDKLKEILSLIGRILKLDNYMDINIELPEETEDIADKILKHYDFTYGDSVFVNFEQYKKLYKGIKGFENIPHLMDWEEKQKLKRPENFGSRADKRPLKWKQALLKSEKIIYKMKNFEQFVNENNEEKKDWYVTISTEYVGTDENKIYRNMTRSEAESRAYEDALDWADSYSNLWIDSVSDEAESIGVDEESEEYDDIYNQIREENADYSIEEYDPEKHVDISG